MLDVEDDGPGMTADQAQRVFERFYRADAARNRASGGTGLGLAIVAGLVSAHGGTVSVRTEPGQGADFQVKLPLSPDVLGIRRPGRRAAGLGPEEDRGLRRALQHALSSGQGRAPGALRPASASDSRGRPILASICLLPASAASSIGRAADS